VEQLISQTIFMLTLRQRVQHFPVTMRAKQRINNSYIHAASSTNSSLPTS